jgi:hypothetical protein
LYADHIPKYLKNIDVAYIFAAVCSGSKGIVERPEIFLKTNSTMNQKTILTLVQAKVKRIVFPNCSIKYNTTSFYRMKMMLFFKKSTLGARP